MHIDQLRYLILIQRLGSINKASEQVHISQQALSTSIKKLENEIGHDLLIRHTHGVSLTENGRLLAKFADNMLPELDNTLSQMKATNMPVHNTKEKLQVFFTPAIGNTFVPDISKLFTRTHPNTQLMLMEKEAKEITEMIFKDNLPTLGLIGSLGTLPPLPILKSYFSFSIYDDKLYIVISKAHPLANQKSVSLHTILKYPLAIYQGSHASANNVCALLEAAGEPNYLTITNNLKIYQDAILYQNALGFINKSALKNHTALPDIIDDVITLPIRNAPSLSFLAIATTDYFNAHEQSIRDFLHIFQSLF